MEQRNLPNATASLVLGILSIPSCFCYGLLGLALGIIAIILGKKAKKVYAEDPNTYSGIGNANAGYITGIVGVILGALYLILIVFLIATIGWAGLRDPSIWQNI